MDFSALVLSLHIYLFIAHRAAFGATFTFVNKCDYTVWPGILANAGSPRLGSTGFELPQHSSRSFNAPVGWSGRFWGRTGCSFSDDSGSCQTGDCGSGQTECNGSGAAPPATLAEFTLGTGGLDFYDVSLVDGYNLPVVVEATGGSGLCASTGCVTDLSRACPSELRVGGGKGCKSACEAFGKPEYCCSGAYNSPNSCRPSVYSQMFKAACPRSYSYAYDDPTSTFTCSGADYTVTFCPSMPSQKSSHDPTPTISSNDPTPTVSSNDPTPTVSSNDPTPTMATPGSSNADGSLTGSDTTGTVGTEPGPVLGITGSDPGLDSGSVAQPMLTDKTWLAGLAMGDSTRFTCRSAFHSAGSIASTFLILTIFYF